METDLSRQGIALLIALLLGAGIGVLYDLLRPLRHRSGRLAGAVLDVLFCAASGCAAFTYAMSAGDGRLGIWELAAALVGFLLYMHTLSAPLLRIFTILLDALYTATAVIKKFIGKLFLLAKKCLLCMRKWLRKVWERLHRNRQPADEPEEGTEGSQ